MQRGVEKIAGAVTGEHAPGPVGPVCRGCEAHDQKTCLWIAEARYRPAPVGLVLERTSAFAGNLFAMLDETGARATAAHLSVEDREPLVAHRTVAALVRVERHKRVASTPNASSGKKGASGPSQASPNPLGFSPLVKA